jgi:NADH-quinone oxidoreductase subunit J
VFYQLGAHVYAALEVIIYAGAIVVLIIFVILMLNLKSEAVDEEREWMKGGVVIGPSVLFFDTVDRIVLHHFEYGDGRAGVPKQ